jgi:capsular polysaccharide biosynthesis protein
MEGKVQLMRQAAMIAGVSGAALTHAVFARPGTALVVLLVREQEARRCFSLGDPWWFLAQSLGLRYHGYVVCEEGASFRGSHGFAVDLDAWAKFLALLV